MNGELYPCKPYVFKKTYSAVGNETKQPTDSGFAKAVAALQAPHRHRFSGEDSILFWDAVRAAEPYETGILYEHGCLAQRMEAALMAAKRFIDCGVSDPDMTDEMIKTYEYYKNAMAEFE